MHMAYPLTTCILALFQDQVFFLTNAWEQGHLHVHGFILTVFGA